MINREKVHEAREAVISLCKFAFEQGFHELGYDPLEVLLDALDEVETDRDNLRKDWKYEQNWHEQTRDKLSAAEARIKELEAENKKMIGWKRCCAGLSVDLFDEPILPIEPGILADNIRAVFENLRVQRNEFEARIKELERREGSEGK